MLIERTEIIKKLGISGKVFKRIVYYGNIQYKVVNNQKCYDFDEIIEGIKKGKNG